MEWWSALWVVQADLRRAAGPLGEGEGRSGGPANSFCVLTRIDSDGLGGLATILYYKDLRVAKIWGPVALMLKGGVFEEI